MLHCDKQFIVPVQIAATTKALLLRTRHCYSKFRVSSTWEENSQMNKINSIITITTLVIKKSIHLTPSVGNCLN